jgi:transcriptional regulator with XRE-family HTH domain
MDQQVATEKPQRVRPAAGKQQPNKLRDWFDGHRKVMTKTEFARLLGTSTSYVSQLCSDNPPWPGRQIALRIALITRGKVTPNDLANFPPA